MAIREEEYAILAFAMESIVSELLIRHPSLSPPRVYLIDGVPKLGAGREDLVFWWHQSVEKFTHLKNETRIDLLKVSEEKEGFERRKFRELGLEIGGLDHNNLPKTEKWEFSLSRVGLDRASRQALVHVWAKAECNAQCAAGFILVVGWGEEGTLHVLERVMTGTVE
ncbi:MAG: hypothetical protein VCA73_16115 [Roseibacillus sp.]|jgi:hypothetical protein